MMRAKATPMRLRGVYDFMNILRGLGPAVNRLVRERERESS